MASESLVQVNEGVGKKFHTINRTIGANSVEEQVVIGGDPFVAGYVLSFDAALLTTANSHVIELMAGGTLNTYVRRISLYQLVVATTVAMCQFNLYRLTTAGTGGTSFTPVQLDTSDAAAGSSGMTLATTKGTEGNPLSRRTAWLGQTLGASAQWAQPIVEWRFDVPGVKPIRIGAGTAIGIAVKNITAVAAASVVGEIWFTEQNY